MKDTELYKYLLGLEVASVPLASNGIFESLGLP